MKKFLIFALLILFFTLTSLFTIEKGDLLGLNRIALQATFQEKDGQLQLSWERLPYPCFYRVDTLVPTTGLVAGEEQYKLLDSQYTMRASCELPGTAIPVVYRVSAFGMFGQLTAPSEPVANPDYPDPVRPMIISHYDASDPASLMPFLIWHKVPGAVCYEVELLSAPPASEGGTEHDTAAHLESTHQIFTNGWQADLKKYQDKGRIWWRVRALDLHLQAIGEWSTAEPLTIDPARQAPRAPMLNNYDIMPGAKMPVYPVYHWIPLHDIMHYEVELLTQPPAEEHGSQPDPNRVWSRIVDSATACYDEYPRPYAGDYYWRVRALDKNNNPIGTWSDTAHFVVGAPATRVTAAALGDSITHGGGAVSISPAELEYSYLTYLDFPCLNLGRSGDTSSMTLARFDTDVLPCQPLNLLILTGTNSLRSTTITAEQVIADLRAIGDKCRANDIRPIYLTLMPINPQHIKYAFHTDTDPNWRAKLTTINRWIRNQEYHVDLEPYFYDDSQQVLDPKFSIDGLHNDIYGKMLMGEIINRHTNLLRQP
ncbi:MAG: GDSL-type esterase/lipase family protein [Selenomonadaceae bacterium]|nr:GDSL-type esterase/lipase family protein [Selenomonadaceae bacterium]